MPGQLDLTIIIPTHNRAESLAETLACLQRADREGIDFEVAVVENGIRDGTETIVQRFSDDLPVSYFYEPQAGKSLALIRGISEAKLGTIVAVLDDDMSPEPDWLQGVMSISRRWPQHGYYSGISYIIWPDVEVPDWARSGYLKGWAFSVTGTSLEEDMQAQKGDIVSGNQFWFRSSVLQVVPEFDKQCLNEYIFVFDLQRRGYQGVTGKDAVTGHRVQPDLLDEGNLRKRYAHLGKEFAGFKMRYADLTRPGRLYRRSPFLFFVACTGNLGYWCCSYLIACCHPSSAKRVSGRLRALEKILDRMGLIRYRKLARQHNESRHSRLT